MCTAEIRERRTGKTEDRASPVQIRQPDLENNNAALIKRPKADVASEWKNSCSCSDRVGPELTPFTSSWSHIDKRLALFCCSLLSWNRKIWGHKAETEAAVMKGCCWCLGLSRLVGHIFILLCCSRIEKKPTCKENDITNKLSCMLRKALAINMVRFTVNCMSDDWLLIVSGKLRVSRNVNWKCLG